MATAGVKDIVFALLLQVLMLALFVVFVRYDKAGFTHMSVYPMFQDVHVMVFVGFGFVMTFMRRYGFSAVGFNFLSSALMIQWAILCLGFFELDKDYKIPLSIASLVNADVGAAAVLVSMGVLLGQTSSSQLLLMGFIEIPVFAVNCFLTNVIFKATDAGASMLMHAFGAYFGLGVSAIVGRKYRETESNLEGSSPISDLFAMIGTIFLWMFWPSINAAGIEGPSQNIAILNTYLSLASCCVTAFAISAAFTHEQKFVMAHIQNATLAGGVAVGTAANMMLQPFGALVVGILAGALSVFGYAVLTPCMNNKLKLHDTCGVHNLHGMPGVLGGLVGALMAGLATMGEYQGDLYYIFPARAPVSTDRYSSYTLFGYGRTAATQAACQMIALGVTLVIGILFGLITGCIVATPITHVVPAEELYDDADSWHVPDGES